MNLQQCFAVCNIQQQHTLARDAVSHLLMCMLPTTPYNLLKTYDIKVRYTTLTSTYYTSSRDLAFYTIAWGLSLGLIDTEVASSVASIRFTCMPLDVHFTVCKARLKQPTF
jgi:hypothetical protein